MPRIVERKPRAKAKEFWFDIRNMSTDEQYQYMLEHDILTDCTFVVGPEDGETREFKAHRLHMARMSAVFEAMLLRGEMIEAQTAHVRVTDLSPNTFQLLLSFIYGTQPEMTTFQETQDLAFAANKYLMTALIEICVTRMMTLITFENSGTALEAADLLQEPILKEKCIQVLQCDTLRCITNPRFMQTSEENVTLLLEQDELNVDDELLLVNMIVHWARHAARQRGLSDDDSGVRAVLEPRLLSLFRLLAMSLHHFTFGPGQAGWLTSDEKSAISECMKSKDVSKLPKHLSTDARKRKIVTNMSVPIQDKKTPEIFICKREIVFRPNIPQELCYLVPSEYNMCYTYVRATIIFKVNSSCKWLGFQCASRYREDPTAFATKNPMYPELIYSKIFSFNHSLSIDFKKILIGKEEKYQQEVEYNSNISIMFDEPLTLANDNWFSVEIMILQDCSTCKGIKTPVVQYPNRLRSRSVSTSAGVEFVIRTEQQPGFYTSVNDGLFEALIFSL